MSLLLHRLRPLFSKKVTLVLARRRQSPELTLDTQLFVCDGPHSISLGEGKKTEKKDDKKGDIKKYQGFSLLKKIKCGSKRGITNKKKKDHFYDPDCDKKTMPINFLI